MKNKILVCNLTMFTYGQKVFLVDDNNTHDVGTFSIDDLGKNLVKLCQVYHTHKIHIFGNDEYANNIADQVCGNYYENNKIEVEVN